MTRSQFSHAVGADEKWVENSARLLGRALRYTASEARWLGLVRVLVRDVGLPLGRSAEIAEKAMSFPPDARSAKVDENASGSATLVLDMARYHSSHAAALSAALNLVGSRKRGRPLKPVALSRRTRTDRTSDYESASLARAAQYGVDITALREGLDDSPAVRLRRLEENSVFLGAMRKSASAKRSRSARARGKSAG